MIYIYRACNWRLNILGGFSRGNPRKRAACIQMWKGFWFAQNLDMFDVILYTLLDFLSYGRNPQPKKQLRHRRADIYKPYQLQYFVQHEHLCFLLVVKVLNGTSLRIKFLNFPVPFIFKSRQIFRGSPEDVQPGLPAQPEVQILHVFPKKTLSRPFQGCRFVPYTFSETIRHRWYLWI